MNHEYSISVLERQLEQAMECFLNLNRNKDGQTIKKESDEILKRIQDLQKSVNLLYKNNK